jgi:hypothetical protein
MAIRIAKNQQIGGMAAKDMRDILKKIYEHGLFNQRRLANEIYWLRMRATQTGAANGS